MLSLVFFAWAWLSESSFCFCSLSSCCWANVWVNIGWRWDAKRGSGLASTTSDNGDWEDFGKVRREVEAGGGERWRGTMKGGGRTRGACWGTMDGAVGTGIVDTLCFLEGHPPLSMQCFRQTLRGQSSAMRDWPQPTTRHLPTPWEMGAETAERSGVTVKVGWEESVGDMLGDLDDLRKNLHGSPFVLEPQHCDS